MRRTLFFLICFFSLAVKSFGAPEFYDFRIYANNQTPESFEETDLSDIMKNSRIVFHKHYPLLWQLEGVTAVHIAENGLHSFITGNILEFADGACGGLVTPDRTFGFIPYKSVVLLFTDKYNYLYSTESCGIYAQFISQGGLKAISEEYMCEASDALRLVRSVRDGELLYFDNAQDTVFIFASSDGCFFADSEGDIYLYNRESRLDKTLKYFGRHVYLEEAGADPTVYLSLNAKYIFKDSILSAYNIFETWEKTLQLNAHEDLSKFELIKSVSGKKLYRLVKNDNVIYFID